MKTVLIDVTRLGEKGGFGTINDNFTGTLVSQLPDDIRFVLMVREKYVGAFGDKVSYVSLEHLDRDLRALPFSIDLWHSTDQMYLKRRHRKGMLNLLTVHDLNFLIDKKGIHRIKTFLKLKIAIRRSDYITVISQFVKNDLLAHIDVRKPVQVIYNGIAKGADVPAEHPEFVKSGRPFFFTISQIRKKKNFHRLVPMMKYFPDTDLYICGAQPRPDDVRLITDAISENHLTNVYLPGCISDADKSWMYAHCKAFLFPSLLEGFGLPALEAMAYGAKVFSSKFTSLPEVCQDHATYFDSYEPEKMAETVRQGLEGWSVDCPAAQAEREYCRRFSYERYTEEYISLYRKLLGLPEKPRA